MIPVNSFGDSQLRDKLYTEHAVYAIYYKLCICKEKAPRY